MKITTAITFDITPAVLSRAVSNFIEDCDYNADAIKMYYLEYVLSAAMPYEDNILEFIKGKISFEDKRKIFSDFVVEFEKQFHLSVEDALAEGC